MSSSTSTPAVNGRCDARFAAVRDELTRHIASGDELGASLTVDIGGRTVVDLWGGYRDPDRTRTWEQDTIANTWSTTKTITALAVLMLIDRDLLDPFAPVATYWPEFAEAGKERIEVRHLLSHTSGVSGWDEPFTTEELLDPPHAAERLARQTPWWEPGTASGYHSTTYGVLLGELVRRTAGMTLGQFIVDELAGPTGADFQLGARPADRGRVATIVPPPPVEADLSALPPDSIMTRTFRTAGLDANLANTTPWYDAEVGSANGHGNAHAIATLISAIARDGVVGQRRILSHDTVELVFQEQAHGPDLVLGLPLRWGIGMALSEPTSIPYIRGDRTAFWTGWGGSCAIADPDRQLTIGYVMNRMSDSFIGSDRVETYVDVIEECIPG